LSASHPATITTGQNSVDISVVYGTSQTPAQDALVTLKKDDEVYVREYTDYNGEVTISMTANTTGEMSIVVTKHNFYPYEGSITVEPSENPHLFCSDHVIDDDDTNSSDGNSDTILNPGETIEMPVTLTNSGSMDATNVQVLLRSNSSFVTIEDSMETISSTIQPGQSATTVGNFVFTVSTVSPDTNIQFEVIIDAAEGNFEDDIIEDVKSPDIVHFLNIGSNDPPDGYQLNIKILNPGSGKAREVIGNLSIIQGNGQIVDGTHNYGNLTSGQQKNGDYYFNYYENLTNFTFLITFTDYYGNTWAHQFELIKPAAANGLSFMPNINYIDLNWTPNSESDLKGYYIYRSDTETGSYQLLNNDPITGSYYQDTAVQGSAVRYYYKITAIDTSCNESQPSTILVAWTSVGYQTGWPQAISQPSHGTIAVYDVNGAGGYEIFMGSAYGNLYAWQYNGEAWLNSYDIFAYTNSGFHNAPAVGDVDNDGQVEVVVATCNDSRVYILNSLTGEMETMFTIDESIALYNSPALGDINGDGDLEIVLPTFDNGLGDHNGKLYAWEIKNDEWQTINNSPFIIEGASYNHSTVALADLDGDNYLEIILGGGNTDKLYVFDTEPTYPSGSMRLSLKWEFSAGADVNSSSAIGDIDNDGNLEIVFTSANDKLWVLDKNGNIKTGWTDGKYINTEGWSDRTSSPALGDIDDDGFLEIVISGVDSVYIFEHDGSRKSPWPIPWDNGSSNHSVCSPVIGDIDGDGDMEIVIGSANYYVYAWHVESGEAVIGWPAATGNQVVGTPALVDVDNDDDMEVIAASRDGFVYIWDNSSEGQPPAGEWAMFHQGPWHTGVYGFEPPLPPENITVMTPNGNELLGIGEIEEIRWASPGFDANVKIEYTLDAGSSWLLIEDTYPDAGSYMWTIPNRPSNKGCLIRISDAQDSVPADESDSYFYISKSGEFVPEYINVGGQQYIDENDQTWFADKLYTLGGHGFIDGYAVYSNDPISGTHDDYLYQQKRENITEYCFDVHDSGRPKGPQITHPVTLYFTESEYTLPNERVFDILIEGEVVYPDFDIIQIAGGPNIALEMNFNVYETDGTINIGFTPKVGLPVISAIRTPNRQIPIPTNTEERDNDLNSPLNITISSPENNITLYKPNVIVNGTITENTGIIFINGIRVETKECKFETEVPLLAGRNVIKVEGNDFKHNRSYIDSVVVIYEKLTTGIYQNYPNPFNTETAIKFSISGPNDVELQIYNSLGQLVRTFKNRYNQAGIYRIVWNGKNESGHAVASGIYYLKLKVNFLEKTKQMILLK